MLIRYRIEIIGSNGETFKYLHRPGRGLPSIFNLSLLSPLTTENLTWIQPKSEIHSGTIGRLLWDRVRTLWCMSSQTSMQRTHIPFTFLPRNVIMCFLYPQPGIVKTLIWLLALVGFLKIVIFLSLASLSSLHVFCWYPFLGAESNFRIVNVYLTLPDIMSSLLCLL